MKKILHFIQTYGFWILLTLGITVYAYIHLPHKIEMDEITIYQSDQNTLTKLHFPKDSTTIVHFYAHWCGPCMKELPELIARKKELNAQGCRLICITDDEPTVQQQFEKKFGIQIFRTPSLKSLNVFSIPMTYFYDANGAMTSRQDGMCVWNEQWIKEKLKEMNHE